MPKRRRDEDADPVSDDGNEQDQEALLAVLNSHGQSFMASFAQASAPIVAASGSKNKKRKMSKTAQAELTTGNVEEDEWQGIATRVEAYSDSETQSDPGSDAESDSEHCIRCCQLLVRAHANGLAQLPATRHSGR